jgi:Spy/CpxP family protein refolding chaperone
MKVYYRFIAFAFVVTLLSARAGFSAETAQSAVQAKPTETTNHLSGRELLKRLQLTDDQRKQLRQNRAAYRKAMAVIDGELKINQVDMDNELEKPEPDQAKLDLIVQKIGELYGKKLSEKIKAKLEFEKKILTPQQLDLLRTLQGKEGPEENL